MVSTKVGDRLGSPCDDSPFLDAPTRAEPLSQRLLPCPSSHLHFWVLGEPIWLADPQFLKLLDPLPQRPNPFIRFYLGLIWGWEPDSWVFFVFGA